MKIKIDDNNYIEIKKYDKESLSMKIKVKKDANTDTYIDIKLSSDMADSMITELVKLRAKID